MFDKLFEPLKIGPVVIKNRIALSPMNMVGDRDKHPTKQYTCYFNARAQGGFGLLITGSIITSKEASDEYPFVPALYRGSLNFGYYTDFVESVHSQGTNTKIFAQLSPGFGRQTGKEGARGASPIPFKREDIYEGMECKQEHVWNKFHLTNFTTHLLRVPRALTIEEIQKDQKNFIWAAEKAILFGFDGIEIHACHGYMLHQFLSPRSNQRTDKYGGSVENRARYVLELIEICKKTFGDAVPILVRMSAREYQPDGITPEDMRRVAYLCQEAGADAIDLSNGSGYDDMNHFFCLGSDNVELLEAQGRKLKETITIPVITPGLTTPAVAEKAVADGLTDMVSLGRQALADPDWPSKVKEGRVKDIITCDKDNFCIRIGLWGGQASMRCTQNPNFGKEEFNPQYWPKPLKGRVPPTLLRWKPGLKWQATDQTYIDFHSKRKKVKASGGKANSIVKIQANES
jgi:2,4-dienoyl-CoA reductase-like NADH-dependent reductase (Old Yellow Enzyme family)